MKYSKDMGELEHWYVFAMPKGSDTCKLDREEDLSEGSLNLYAWDFPMDRKKVLLLAVLAGEIGPGRVTLQWGKNKFIDSLEEFTKAETRLGCDLGVRDHPGHYLELLCASHEMLRHRLAVAAENIQAAEDALARMCDSKDVQEAREVLRKYPRLNNIGSMVNREERQVLMRAVGIVQELKGGGDGKAG